jgi:hypothetical protein
MRGNTRPVRFVRLASLREPPALAARPARPAEGRTALARRVLAWLRRQGRPAGTGAIAAGVAASDSCLYVPLRALSDAGLIDVLDGERFAARPRKGA